VEIQKKIMDVKEVARAYREMDVEDKHFSELLVTINNNYDIDEVATELGKLK